MIGEYAN